MDSQYAVLLCAWGVYMRADGVRIPEPETIKFFYTQLLHTVIERSKVLLARENGTRT